MARPSRFDPVEPARALAIRRHTDRCFHRIEEEVPEGYIVEGILIAREEVAEVRELDGGGAAPGCVPPCRPAGGGDCAGGSSGAGGGAGGA